LPFLRHEDEGVRQVAAKALGRFGKGEEIVVKAVANLLQEPRQSFRKTALKALRLVANIGDDLAVEEVSQHLKHSNNEVRIDALVAVAHIAGRNDYLVLDGICFNLLDRDVRLQKAAAASFDKCVDTGSSLALHMLLGHVDLTSDDDHSLRTMVQALPRVTGSGDEAVELVASVLQRQSMAVRSALFDALLQLVSRNYARHTIPLCDCWATYGLGVEFLPASGQAPDDSCDVSHRVVQIAARSLSLCLLRPNNRIPDMLAKVLNAAGRNGDSAATILSRCMSHDRWFLRWEAIEYLSKVVFLAQGDEHMLTSLVSAVDGVSLCCLHRSGCPCTDGNPNPPKRPRVQ
jgi:hypothetical protein